MKHWNRLPEEAPIFGDIRHPYAMCTQPTYSNRHPRLGILLTEKGHEEKVSLIMKENHLTLPKKCRIFM